MAGNQLAKKTGKPLGAILSAISSAWQTVKATASISAISSQLIGGFDSFKQYKQNGEVDWKRTGQRTAMIFTTTLIFGVALGLGPKFMMKGCACDDPQVSQVQQSEKNVTEKSVTKGIDNKDLTKLTVEDIPTAKSGDFDKFFNSLTSRELDELWKDKKIRKKIERQLREPGGLHEWHLVSRAPQFKNWNISAKEIKDLRTAISDVNFVNPNGVHGGLGSTKAHNELLAIIDTSSDYNSFVRRLNNWANYRLEGGVSSLPEGLRLK